MSPLCTVLYKPCFEDPDPDDGNDEIEDEIEDELDTSEGETAFSQFQLQNSLDPWCQNF